MKLVLRLALKKSKEFSFNEAILFKGMGGIDLIFNF
jgi:hypothetical protein